MSLLEQPKPGPRADDYATVTRHGRDDVLHLASFAGVAIRVADVLPPEGEKK